MQIFFNITLDPTKVEDILIVYAYKKAKFRDPIELKHPGKVLLENSWANKISATIAIKESEIVVLLSQGEIERALVDYVLQLSGAEKPEVLSAMCQLDLKDKKCSAYVNASIKV